MMALGWIVVLAVAQPDSAQPISLADAIARAQRHAPQAIQAAGQQRTSAIGARSTYAAFLPNVTLSAGANRQFTSGSGTQVQNGQVVTLSRAPWSYNGSIGASVDLFDGGRRWFNLVQARADTRAAAANVVAQGFAVALAVKQQFFDVLAARESQAAARAQLGQAEQQYRAATLRVRAKTATRSDSLRAEIQLRNARLAVANASNQLEVGNAALTRLVAAEQPVTAAAVDGDPETLALSEDELRALIEDGPGVRQARAQLESARAQRRASWTSYLPNVSASYSRSGSGTDTGFSLGGASSYDFTGSFRLSASLPIFNQLQREDQVVRADVAEANATAALRDARLAAVQSLAQSLGAFRTAGLEVEAYAASVAAAEEDLRVQQRRYEVGESTLLDVLTSQTQLDQARQSLIRARYDRRVAKAQIEALAGRDL